MAIDVQARIAIVLCCVGLAWFLWRLLDAGRLWIVRGKTIEPSKLRKLLRLLLPLLLMAIATIGACRVYLFCGYDAAIVIRKL
ncbi:MAG: hypothetical protein V9G16_00685 [Nitrosomonas sp.]